MPLITVGAGTPTIPAGTYPATLIGVAPKSLVTRFSKNGEEQDFLEWTWACEGTEISSLTSLATGPKSTMLTYLVALVGKDQAQIGAGFDEDDLIGKQVMLSIEETPEGFSKVNGVVGAPKSAKAIANPGSKAGRAAARAAVAAPVADDGDDDEEDDGDDLPF